MPLLPRIHIPRIPFMHHRPEFPSVADLPTLAPEDAQRVLDALRKLEQAELVDVYSSSGSDDTKWNVWSNIRWCRIPLPEWAAEWLATQESDSPDSKEARHG